MVSSLINSTDKKIGEFKAAFQHLSECFTRGVNVQTWVAVSHLSDKIDDISNQVTEGYRKLHENMSMFVIITSSGWCSAMC
jgi:hypothetical protein